jgi:uncharacterized protein (TIGR04222 family)
MEPTWGITGPAFLALYLGAMVIVAVLATIHRKVLFRGNSDARVDDLGPQQVAFLNGGDRLAIYAALSGLRASGAIGAGPGHTLTQTGPIPAGVTPLDAAVHNAAGRQVRARDLRDDQFVRSALDQLRDGLERRGLVNSKETLRTGRLWALAAAALLLVGILRLIAGIQNDKPVLLLLPLLFITGVLVLVLAMADRLATAAAVQGMRALRLRNGHLSPRQSPAYATYGASGAAMGVALFGAASLYDMDPAFAAEAQIQRAAIPGDGSGSFNSGSSCGSGSSSCGGGGGGGCGGGGCGG